VVPLLVLQACRGRDLPGCWFGEGLPSLPVLGEEAHEGP
jgi:hypothetical protein